MSTIAKTTCSTGKPPIVCSGRSLRAIVGLLLVVGLTCVGVSVARASGGDVLHDCADDEELSKTYTQDEYREALDNMDGDMQQYTNCEAVIVKAQRDAARQGDTADTGRVSASREQKGDAPPTRAEAAAILARATPQQREALANAASQPPPPVSLAGVGPLDVSGADPLLNMSRRDLPVQLQVVIAMLAAAGVMATVEWARRVATRRRRPLT